MEIKYHLTEEDYINFNMFHIRNSKTAMRSLTIQRFIGPIIFIISSYVFSKIGDVPFLGLFITFLILSILWVIFYPKYFYSHIIRHVKKMIKEGKNDGLLGEHHMMMTEDGIVDSTTNGETKVNWSGIQQVKENEDYFYLYNSSVSAYILPKRELHNLDEINSFLKSKI
ncbi:YcxB family protein [Bacillus sp. Bva_UNVM-123]|uniref:YcxB family protein n=1 Tax=Bacillus sp. Bva_UNVM-123 TaxID=2829798 RepID=UPI00391EE7EF